MEGGTGHDLQENVWITDLGGTVMTDTDTKELKVREKQTVTSQGEPTRPGAVYTPDVDIFESDHEITLLADIPGVTTDNLSIDLRDES